MKEAAAGAPLGVGAEKLPAGMRSLADLVRRRGVELGARVAYVAPDRTWTFAELDAETSRIARGLATAGVGAGDCVACLTRRGADAALLLFAASKVGAVLAPLNWRLAARELEYVLGVAQPKVLLADAFLAQTLSELALPLKPLQLVTDAPAGAASFREWAADFPAIDPGSRPGIDDPAARLFSSGTTGLPKAVELAHRGFLVQCTGWTGPFRYAHGDTTHLNVLPTFHVSGIVNAVWTVYLGGTSVFYPEFDAARFLAAIEQHRITDTFAVPAMLRTMVDSEQILSTNLSSLRSIAYGGSPIDEALLVKCLERFGCGFLQVYGMTEGNGTLTALLPEDHDPRGPRAYLLRSVGRPAAHIEIKIVSPTDGRLCADDEVGELWIRSRQLMRGYYGDELATDAAYPEGREPDGGWFRSGDAGYLRDGYLYLHDRIKDMIISGGENVYPAEVELALASHPAVAELAVIGVPHEKWGETVKACVVLRAGASAGEAELIRYARERLAHYKCPTSIDFLDVLPRNPGGKLLKRVLREPYWSGRTRPIA